MNPLNDNSPHNTLRQTVDATVRSYMKRIGAMGGGTQPTKPRGFAHSPETARAAAHARWRNHRQNKARELALKAARGAGSGGGR